MYINDAMRNPVRNTSNEYRTLFLFARTWLDHLGCFRKLSYSAKRPMVFFMSGEIGWNTSFNPFIERFYYGTTNESAQRRSRTDLATWFDSIFYEIVYSTRNRSTAPLQWCTFTTYPTCRDDTTVPGGSVSKSKALVRRIHHSTSLLM